MTIKRVSIGGGRTMAVHLTGGAGTARTEAPPAAASSDVLLLHGIPGSGLVWRRVAEGLAENHRVLAPDLLGFGESSRPSTVNELWAQSQTAAVAQMLDVLGSRHVHVVGHDFGGTIAVLLARRVPRRVASLTIAATNAFTDTPIPFPLSGVLPPVIGGLWSRMLFSRPSLHFMVRTGMGEPRPEDVDSGIYVGDRGQVRTIRFIFTAALREIRDRYAPIEEALRDCPVPSAVLWGTRDPFFDISQGERTVALMGNARWIPLDGAGHFLPEERPDAVVDAVRTFAE